MLGAYQLMASITSFILLVKSCVAFTRDPTQIEMVGQANFCTYDELFSINVFCCLFGIGNAGKIQHVANSLALSIICCQFMDCHGSLPTSYEKVATQRDPKNTTGRKNSNEQQ